MRARAGMVECFLALGDKANVIKQCKDLLKLSSNDNMGMRDILLPLLIETGKDKQAETLYKIYREDYSSAWFYGRALLDYRKYGEGEVAHDSLGKALSLNKIAPKYLLMKKKYHVFTFFLMSPSLPLVCAFVVYFSTFSKFSGSF